MSHTVWCRSAKGSAPFRDFSTVSGQTPPDNADETSCQEMRAPSVHRQITDELLALMVRLRREAGVGAAEIQAAIDRFASHEQWQERTGGICFPLVEDIPQNQRADF